jgi:hypothetical protein
MDGNMYMIFISALIPMIIGAIWYNPKVLGNAWMKSSGVTEEQTKTGNMLMIFGVSYLFAVLMSIMLIPITTHQSGIMSLFVMDADFGVAGSASTEAYNAIMNDLGAKHRTFGHGAMHGVLAAITIALPVIGTLALFERRSWKYIWIHAGYWIISMALMGGVICQFV